MSIKDWAPASARAKIAGTRRERVKRSRIARHFAARGHARHERGGFVALAVGCLRRLGRRDARSATELGKHKGMGLAAYAQFAHRVGNRAARVGRRVAPSLAAEQRPQAVGDYLRLRIGHERVEIESFALFLDAHNRLLAAEEIARGTLSESVPIRAKSPASRCNATPLR